MKLLTKKIFTLITATVIFTSCTNTPKEEEAVVPVDDTINISIATYAKSSFLESSADAYMIDNPNVNITINTYAPDVSSEVTDAENSYLIADDTGTFEKYIKNINTSIMANDDTGNDIIMMDVLPFYKYAESGYLTDLNTFISEDTEFNVDDYYGNMISSMEYNSGLYAIPIDYEGYIYSINSEYNGIDGIADVNGDPGLVSNQLEKGEKAVLENPDAGMYLYKDAYSLFKILYDENYNDFINLKDNTVNYDSEEFKNLLGTVKNLVDENVILPQQDGNMYTYFLSYDSMWTPSILMPYFGMEDVFDGNYRLATDSTEKAYFSAPHSLAISENSNNKDEAWKFIKYLLSEEVQSSPEIFPVNKNALHNGFKNEIIKTLDDAAAGGMILTDESAVIADSYISLISKWSDELSTYHFKDATVEQIVRLEVNSFFNNGQDVDTTAKNIQSKVSTYLNE